LPDGRRDVSLRTRILIADRDVDAARLLVEPHALAPELLDSLARQIATTYPASPAGLLRRFVDVRRFVGARPGTTAIRRNRLRGQEVRSALPPGLDRCCCYSVLQCATVIRMKSRTITQRELRNQSAAVLREVEAGRTIIVSRNGTPVGELRPIRRRRFVPRAAIADAAGRAARIDAAQFRADLDAVVDPHAND